MFDKNQFLITDCCDTNDGSARIDSDTELFINLETHIVRLDSLVKLKELADEVGYRNLRRLLDVFEEFGD